MVNPKPVSEIVTEHPQVQKQEVKRYVSVDFLRGASIFSMLVLHTVMITLDVDHYTNQISDIALINIIALITLPYIGGLAGIFLMTSAIGNMIAMQRNLQKGKDPRAVMNKQIFIGFLIVIFAMLSEGVIGYHGSVGNLILNRANPWETSLYRIFTTETINTIGWCIILNGIVHVLLARKYDVRFEIDKIIKGYWIGIAVVLLITQPVWMLTSAVWPGYPFETNPLTGRDFYQPVIGTSPIGDLVFAFFVNPFAAPIEPVLPYLATSFMGGIIGLELTREKTDKSFVRRYYKIGIWSFFIGLVGMWVLLGMLGDIDAILDMWRHASYHRRWTDFDNPMTFASTGEAIRTPFGWFFQYLSLNGLALVFVCLAIRLIEYRGNAAYFAKKSAFIRRFGFIAFTVYTAQWVIYPIWLMVGSAFGFDVLDDAGSIANKVLWPQTWIIGFLSIFLLDYIMRKWEKKGYIGSIEWMISSIANSFVKIKRQASHSDDPSSLKWYERGKLNVKDVFYGPTWVNFEVDEETRVADDIRLIKRLNRWGFLLFPLHMVAFSMIRNLNRNYPEANTSSLKLLNRLGLLFFAIWLVLSMIFSLSSFGVSL